MNKITLSTLIIMITTLTINANIFENIKTKGYLRSAYEIHAVEGDDTFRDGAIGGKLHIETAPAMGISLGSSFYTSEALGSSDNGGLVPFRGEVANSYSILGEAYIRAILGKTELKIGRQEIEIPFAQTDDIGMVPNTFEAYIVENKDISDTTLFVAQIQKMAGVDAEVVDKFTPINGHHNMQVLGLTYEGVENLILTAWYNRLKDAEVNSISYLEASYEKESYTLALQYANQTHTIEQDSQVYGISASWNIDTVGLTFSAAYNKIKGSASFSGFGGGPFFANSEYLIPDNAGDNSSQSNIGVAWDASSIGVEKLTLSLNHARLVNSENKTATEIDMVVGYSMGKHFETHLIASRIKGKNVGEENANHMRGFVNYYF